MTIKSYDADIPGNTQGNPLGDDGKNLNKAEEKINSSIAGIANKADIVKSQVQPRAPIKVGREDIRPNQDKDPMPILNKAQEKMLQTGNRVDLLCSKLEKKTMIKWFNHRHETRDISHRFVYTNENLTEEQANRIAEHLNANNFEAAVECVGKDAKGALCYQIQCAAENAEYAEGLLTPLLPDPYKNLSKQEANNLLSQEKEGTWLIRFCQDDKCYKLSSKTTDGVEEKMINSINECNLDAKNRIYPESFRQVSTTEAKEILSKAEVGDWFIRYSQGEQCYKLSIQTPQGFKEEKIGSHKTLEQHWNEFKLDQDNKICYHPGSYELFSKNDAEKLLSKKEVGTWLIRHSIGEKCYKAAIQTADGVKEERIGSNKQMKEIFRTYDLFDKPRIMGS